MIATLIDRLAAATSADELEAAIAHAQAHHDDHGAAWSKEHGDRATAATRPCATWMATRQIHASGCRRRASRRP